jgi:hypothetical protein
MARSDYRLCDVRDGKAFYDANLNYFGRVDASGYPVPDYVGDWAVLCTDCAKTHIVEIHKRATHPELDREPNT